MHVKGRHGHATDHQFIDEDPAFPHQKEKPAVETPLSLGDADNRLLAGVEHALPAPSQDPLEVDRKTRFDEVVYNVAFLRLRINLRLRGFL